MGRKAFHEFFVTQQKQYNKMTKVLEKVNKELVEGKCTQEQRDNFEEYYRAVENNYQRIMYIQHLLRLPPKFILNRRKKKLLKKQEEEFKKMNADKESVIKENDEAIDKMEKQLEEIQGNSDGEN